MRGEFLHTMDAKGRLFIPAKFREKLGAPFVITRGLENCLTAYPMDEWEKFAASIAELKGEARRKLNRFFVAGAQDCELDAQGRVLIEQVLRMYANLSKNVVIAGMTNYIEIWDQETWLNQNSNPTEIAGIMEVNGL